MNFTKHFLFFAGLMLALTSCKKDEKDPIPSPSSLSNGILVLNEGLFQLNNATLSWYSKTDNSTSNQFFEKQNERLLGDTGNDMKRYGSKIYVVVNVSSTIEVIDVHTGKSIKQISMLNGNTSKQPRAIDFHGSYAFVSCFDGFVDVIDTASLEVVRRIPVGLNPDGILRSGTSIFVSNSGGLNTPLMDSTISIIDPVNLTETKRITVGLNPGSIKADLQGNIYVIARGNYSTIPSKLVRLAGANFDQVKTFSFLISGLANMDDKLLVSYEDQANQKSKIAVFNPTTELIEQSNLFDLSSIKTLSGMVYRPEENLLYLLDANGYTTSGFVRSYTLSGQLTKQFQVGLIPSSLLFID